MPLVLKYSSSQPMMGTTATITVLAENPESHVGKGMKMLTDLHNLWSRFLPTSDISRLNVANGKPTFVSQRTTHLIRCMQVAHAATKGYYNPTLLPIQHQLGDNMSRHTNDVSYISPSARPYEALNKIEIIDTEHVQIPADMTLDAGGIGKGMASDFVAKQLLTDGALSVSINIGGDIRVGCSPNYAHDWDIEILDFHRTVISVVSLRNGAIATSSSNVRADAPGHITSHVLQISNSNDSRMKTACVISSEAMWAEAWTKYVMLAPQPFTDLEETGQSALLAVEGSAFQFSKHWKEFEL